MKNPGRLITQKELLQQVWGPQYGNETNYLRVLPGRDQEEAESRIRADRRFFITEPGVGYRFGRGRGLAGS